MACIWRGFSSSISQSGPGVVVPKKAYSWLTISSPSPSKSSPIFVCMSLPLHPYSTALLPMTLVGLGRNDSLLTYLVHQPSVLPSEVDDTTKTTSDFQEKIRRGLGAISTPVSTMKLIDTIQRLGIAYQFEEEINILLQDLSHGQPDEDLYTAALRFRLLRSNGHHVSPDIFKTFTELDGKFKESLNEDILGLLSLYEASYLGANGEDILSQAMEYTETHLNQKKLEMAPQLRKQVLQSLELPRHLRMERLEARRYIEEYSMESNHNSTLLELAKLDYNHVQSLHQMELAEITRWWKHLGLVDKLCFARDRPLECFLWTVGILPEPKYSGCRIELAKTITILLVIDDVYDTHGSFDDLVLFTEAIRRWDLDATEQLPEYMKICYMALYNTTNEICYNILKEHGCIWSVLPLLKRTWMDMIEGFMVEAEWVRSGHVPILEDYLENGVTTAGSYMALVHIFFLIGQGVTNDNAKLLVDPYPKLFSSSGRILRLWDDLGTAKEEQERGDVASSIQLYMREKGLASDEEGRKHIEQLIRSLWKELNGELMASKALPVPIIKASLNMSRTSQVVYQHEEDSYFSSVDNYVQALFFTPIV